MPAPWRKALIVIENMDGVRGARLVNPKVAHIFNGIFETRKSTRNEQKSAQMRANDA
jgi:hypothetical protein